MRRSRIRRVAAATPRPLRKIEPGSGICVAELSAAARCSGPETGESEAGDPAAGDPEAGESEALEPEAGEEDAAAPEAESVVPAVSSSIRFDV